MPGKRTLGTALIDLVGATLQAAGRQYRRHRLDHLPRTLLRDLNLPCCGPVPT